MSQKFLFDSLTQPRGPWPVSAQRQRLARPPVLGRCHGLLPSESGGLFNERQIMSTLTTIQQVHEPSPTDRAAHATLDRAVHDDGDLDALVLPEVEVRASIVAESLDHISAWADEAREAVAQRDGEAVQRLVGRLESAARRLAAYAAGGIRTY
jgi:hypothetical protein